MHTGDEMLAVFLLAQLVRPVETSDFESSVINLVSWIRLCIEILSVVIILLGIAITLYKVFRLVLTPGSEIYNQVRFVFSRYLIMGLEFQLAADIIGTAVSPSWDQLGKLAVIATIRTFLSFFLQYEMKGEKPQVKNTPVDTDADRSREA